MSNWIVQDRASGIVTYAYAAENADHFDDYPLETYNHIRQGDIVEIQPSRRVTKLDFVARLGDAAFDELLLMARTSVGIEKFVKLIDWSTPDPDGTSIDLDDPRVQAVHGIEPLLIASGKVSAGWADSVLA